MSARRYRPVPRYRERRNALPRSIGMKRGPGGEVSLLLTLMLLLAACGGSATTAPAPATTAAPTGPPVAAAPAPPPAAATGAPTTSVPATITRSATSGASPMASSAPAPAFDPARMVLALEPFATSLRSPVFVTGAADGSNRRFVVEKGGTIRLLPEGRPFLDISNRVLSSGSEQGLLGLAFHPRFRENGLFYVNYTALNGDDVIARFGLTADRGASDPASERRLIAQKDPAPNHNGGMLAFGPDGYLYVGLGDGGGANDIYGNGQNRQTLLGKILRLDVDRGDPYAIPPDNPFVNDSVARPEIWAYGLRNPWRFSFDRATHDLYIGDVGQNAWEWVHFQPAGSPGGQNYGWPIVEGAHCLRGAACDRTGLVPPVAEYAHSLGCSITGGYVYRGAAYPLLQGAYLFADYCSGRVWTLARDAAGRWITTEMLKTDASISSFGEDDAGELYLTDLKGTVYRVTARAK